MSDTPRTDAFEDKLYTEGFPRNFRTEYIFTTMRELERESAAKDARIAELEAAHAQAMQQAEKLDAEAQRYAGIVDERDAQITALRETALAVLNGWAGNMTTVEEFDPLIRALFLAVHGEPVPAPAVTTPSEPCNKSGTEIPTPSASSAAEASASQRTEASGPVGLGPAPAGWKLVPVRPTEEMLIEAAAFRQDAAFRTSSLWKAMLDVAPEPPHDSGTPDAERYRAWLLEAFESWDLRLCDDNAEKVMARVIRFIKESEIDGRRYTEAPERRS